MTVLSQPQAYGTARFGKFELNVEDHWLKADGETLKLQDRPYQILVILLAQPGKLVSREQLRQSLWPADTNVDFEAGLNTAIRKLRDCLQDDAKSPTFIETVPRVGYRFIAPVSGQIQEPGIAAETVAEAGRPLHFNGVWHSRRTTLMGGGLLAAVLLFIVTIYGLRQWDQSHSASKQIQSLAVLPFVDLSGNANQEYFADGITESLITKLGRNKNVRVISKTSSLHYRGTHLSVREIAAELKVDAVLEGQVLRSNEHVGVTARLIDARTEREIWTQSYHTDERDILEMQDQLARTVSSQMDLNLTDNQAQSKRIDVVDPQAYESYLKGREELDTWSAENLRASAAYFEECTRLAPEFAPAWAGLANDYILQSLFGLMPSSTGIDRAKRAALEALKRDDSLSEAHVAMMSIIGFEYRWSEAENEAKRAVALDPNSAWAHQYYGYLLSSLGRFDQAVEEMKQAAELDPLSSNKQNSLAATLYRAGRYDEALQYFQQVPDPDENSVFRHRRMAAIYEHRGMQQQAAEQMVTMMKLAGQAATATAFEHEFAMQGYDAAKRGFLSEETKQLEAGVKAGKPMLDVLIAGDYLALGDKRNSLLWLKNAVEQHELALVYLAVDDRFVSLSAEPEFMEILSRLNLNLVQQRKGPSSSNSNASQHFTSKQ